MKKGVILLLVSFLVLKSDAQIELAKVLGDKGKDFKIGYGAFLKLAFPISDAASITTELGVNYWVYNDGSGDGMAILPLMVGYRYFLNQEQTGFYIEPQAGYNIYGVESDTKFHGFALAATTGYQIGEGVLDISLRFESIIYDKNLGGPLNFIGLRLARNFFRIGNRGR